MHALGRVDPPQFFYSSYPGLDRDALLLLLFGHRWIGKQELQSQQAGAIGAEFTHAPWFPCKYYFSDLLCRGPHNLQSRLFVYSAGLQLRQCLSLCEVSC